jgi:hypothetical protein
MGVQVRAHTMPTRGLGVRRHPLCTGARKSAAGDDLADLLVSNPDRLAGLGHGCEARPGLAAVVQGHDLEPQPAGCASARGYRLQRLPGGQWSYW